MQTILLDKSKHNRKRFDCGVDALNNYLQLMANQQSSRDNSRTFVLEDENNSQYIIGYYTLTMISIDFSLLPHNIQKRHQHASSSGLIARLAVDKRYAKQGYGEFLLIDALSKLVKASNIVAFPLIVVDAKDGALDFYKKFGFCSLIDEKQRLFMSVDFVRKNFED